MDLFSKCKELYEKIRYFEYGIPVDGVIKPVPSAEYYVKNYHFLKPEEFEKYKGGICWDYVEYERKFLEVNDIDFNQYYLITNTPPNYDTHTFITVKDGDELIYIESSFKRVEHIIDGVQKFKSLEDIVKLITTNMWYCNDNDKHFDEFKYDVCKFKGHPQYGCTCEEYMKWMDDNSDIVIQDVTINPKKVNNDELTVEEFTVNKVDTKFTQFVCESVNDPEEYDETLHDHIDDEDDIYNESWTDFKNGVHPSSGLMFHVSLKNDMDGKTINPQLPSYITDGGKLDDNYQEDTKTKRLCVSPSIEGCLIAILNYNKIREHVGDKFYVYTPEKPFSQYKHKTNKEIVKDKLVFDANITKEAWILEPCKLKLYGIIKLKKVKDLKKKPTVEKNIKMNTIKLDYEWIMTPKASGKFNKAIGDSPDKEDTKEKPIKEYNNILVSNEEFFMEASKYERRLNKQFQRDYERRPKSAIKDYTDKEDKNNKYNRASVNKRVRDLKEIDKKIRLKDSKIKTRNSSNKNKLKALKLLDYDPKTNTIKGNITLPDGSKKKRVPYIIENEAARNMGPFVGSIDEVREMFDSIDFTNDKKPSSTELSRREKVLNTLDQFEKNGEKFVIVIPRKFLNQRHLSGAGASLHELGHFTYIHDPNQSEETERAKAFRDSIKDKLTENSPSYMHLVKNPMGDINATYGIDESNEFSADKYAADRIGVKNYERMLKKIIKFGKKASNKAVNDQINATETQLNLLKNINGESNYKEILNHIKGSAEMFSSWSNAAQESVVQYKSKIKDLDKNIADINRKINEFKDHTSDISDELKELYKVLESAKDERENAVEELKSKRKDVKTNEEYAKKLFNNASFVAQYKALKSSINNFKKWMDDYDVELNERINYIKKYHEKKNIGESCLIMDNNEFFGLSMIQESHKNITKHSFKSLTKKGIAVDHNSETGKLVKKVIDNVLKYHSLPSVKLNPSGFGVAKETDTFFYGYPRYIDGEIPTSKGKQLRFMAQINCKELKSLPDYPHTGLLQFWVHGDSEILDGPVKAIYIEKPNKNNISNVSLDEALYSYDDPGDFPRIDIKGYNHSDNLLFKSTTKEMIGPNITDLEVLYKIFSEEYKKLTGKKADIPALDDYIWNDDRLQPSWGNRVGGYPSSTQETSSKRTKSWNTMLLQLESIDREVYWGDFGIAAFYISHDDLIKKDFSKVGFDWDCY